MFSKMRRGPQALSHEEMTDLLKTETRGVMSVQGDDGYPYGYPINHYYDEETNKIYIHGATFGHRVSAVKKDPKVSYCVFGGEYQKEGDWAKYVKSVIIFGKAELVEDADEIVRISRLLCDSRFVNCKSRSVRCDLPLICKSNNTAILIAVIGRLRSKGQAVRAAICCFAQVFPGISTILGILPLISIIRKIYFCLKSRLCILKDFLILRLLNKSSSLSLLGNCENGTLVARK